jgi:hypothetical protein
MSDNETIEQLSKRIDRFRDGFVSFRDAAILEIARLQLEMAALRSTTAERPEVPPDDTALLEYEQALRLRFQLPMRDRYPGD